MRYLCRLAYDGSHFYGFQRQPKLRTVQGEIESALKRIYGIHITIHSASRTDTGVHALAQCFHYDTDIEIPMDRLRSVIDSQIPEYISLWDLALVSKDFHARYDVVHKTYRYDILNTAEKRIFESNYSLIYRKNLHLEKLQEVCSIFVGKKDYAALMAAGSDKENTVRNIMDVYVEKHGDKVSVFVRADGFLYHMVRIIIGSLLDYNEGRRSIEELKNGLVNKDRTVFRRTAPAAGLYLLDIAYK